MSKKIILHPILIGIFPFLDLLANNLGQIPLRVTIRSGIAALVLCCILYLLLFLLLKRASKAAILASLWLILFYSYGHVFQLIEGKSLFGLIYGRHLFLLVIWLALLAAGSWLALKKTGAHLLLNTILNTVSLFLVLFPLYQIGAYTLRPVQSASPGTTLPALTGASPAAADAAGPDIYYIVLDGYSRADVIQELYGMDNTPFINELKRIGFVLPNCAQSNYGFTGFSVSSTLNMNYVDAFAKNIPWGSGTLRYEASLLYEPIRHSLVRQELKQQGYQMVAFDTGKPLLKVDDAEYFYANQSPLKKGGADFQISFFEDLFMRTTMLRFLIDGNSNFVRTLTGDIQTPNQQQYELSLFALDELVKVQAIPGKKFVFFHILAPHPPYIFDAGGKFLVDEKTGDRPWYVDEVTYLNKRVIPIVRSLIDNAKTPPVIIIQGDHGWDPDPRYKMKILNAYYLPNGGDKLLYPTITPVNTFRLVLNYYFGQKLDFLKDTSYYSLPSPSPEYLNAAPYKPVQVPIECPSDQ